MSRKTKVAAILVFLSLLPALLGPEASAAVCGTYTNSHATFIGGQPVCAYTGGTCGECTALYGSGYTVCVHDSDDITFCMDYQL